MLRFDAAHGLGPADAELDPEGRDRLLTQAEGLGDVLLGAACTSGPVLLVAELLTDLRPSQGPSSPRSLARGPIERALRAWPMGRLLDGLTACTIRQPWGVDALDCRVCGVLG